ncbi:MAG: matrixin family metalloprotease [Sandaracinus sp.]
MRRLALAIAGVLAAAEPAAAWNPIDPSAPRWSGPVPFAMHAPGASELGPDASEAAVTEAFEAWAHVSCTSLAVAYAGRTDALPTPGDGLSTLGWDEADWRYDPSAIAVTQPQWGARTIDGHPVIVEADMELNGVDYTWTRGPGAGRTVDAGSIVLHEAGHFFGLGHSRDPSAAMYYAYRGGVSVLATDDEIAICSLYPNGEPLPTDCHITGCRPGQSCRANGSCGPSTSGGLCTACTSDTDCAAGACLSYPDGQRYCGTRCSSDTECGASARCVAFPDLGTQCVRVAGETPSCEGSPGCASDAACASGERCDVTSGSCLVGVGAGLGAACVGPGECASGLCYEGVCSALCDWLVPSSCAPGFFCDAQGSGTCTAMGLCRPGDPGEGLVGDPCASSTDCAGLFCAEGVCSQPCAPREGGTDCPLGYECQVGTSPSCGSCQRALALGDACTASDACASRLCVDGACTVACDPSLASCPAPFTCEARGSDGICASTLGGLGAACTRDDECLGASCRGGRCTRSCGIANPCPRGYDCASGSGGSVCALATRPASCGCGVVGARGLGTGAAPASLTALVLVLARRRRASRRTARAAAASPLRQRALASFSRSL